MLDRIKKSLRLLSLKFKNRNLAHIGKRCSVSQTKFEGCNSIADGVELHCCELGTGTYISMESKLSHTKIGRYCSIADGVKTVLGNHPTNFVTTYPSFYYDTTSQIGFTIHTGSPLYSKIYKYPEGETFYQIVIGSDVWIGSNVLILGGITIGDGAIIAAGAVVTHDVEPYTIVGGVPAKEIRKRFSKETINKLLFIQWWNLPQAQLKKDYKLFFNIDEYIKKYEIL